MKNVLVSALTAALVVACFYVLRSADASRNSSGTMTAINGPYTAGSVISSSVINARLADIESEISDSKSRAGKGDFSAPARGADGTSTAPTWSFTSETTAGLYRVSSGILAMTYNGTESCRWTSLGIRCANGAVATPSLSFVNDTGSGLYRIASNDIGFAINGALISEWTAGGLTNTLADSLGTFKALSGASNKYATYALGRTATEFKLGIAGATNNFAAGSAAGDTVLTTTGAKMWFDTNAGSGTPSLTIAAANGTVGIGSSLTIGSGGTAITTLTTGTITLSSGSGTATVATGAKCVCGSNNLAVKCSVAATTLTATGTGTDLITYICT